MALLILVVKTKSNHSNNTSVSGCAASLLFLDPSLFSALPTNIRLEVGTLEKSLEKSALLGTAYNRRGPVQYRGVYGKKK